MTQKAFNELVVKMAHLRQQKNNDYGDGFIRSYREYGKKSLFFDLLRKWRRIETFLFHDRAMFVRDETIEDTLMDMAVMCLNAIIALRQDKNNGLKDHKK